MQQLKLLLNETLLSCSNNDYDKVIREAKKLQKLNNLKFLKKMKFFRNWDPNDLNTLNNELETIMYQPNSDLFMQGDATLIFYIVKQGSLIMESMLIKVNIEY